MPSLQAIGELMFGQGSSGSTIVGVLLAAVGIAPNTPEALNFVATLALMTGIFMILCSMRNGNIVILALGV